MRMLTPVMICGSILCAFLFGYSTSPQGAALSQQPADDSPRWTRIPISPDMGEPVHFTGEVFQRAHSLLVDDPRAPIGGILTLPIARTHMFGFRHIAPAAELHGAEVHEGVSELHVVVAGSATAFIGGEVEDRREVTNYPGEFRGTGIEGGRSFQVKKGDVVNIPANAPHAYLSDDPEGITYLIVKINVGLYPWSIISGASLP